MRNFILPSVVGVLLATGPDAIHGQTFTVTPIPDDISPTHFSDNGAVLGRRSFTNEWVYWHLDLDTGPITLPATEADGSPITIHGMNQSGQVLGDVRRLGGQGEMVFCDGVCGPPTEYPIYFQVGFVWQPGQAFPTEPQSTTQSFAPSLPGFSISAPSYAADGLGRLIVYEQWIERYSDTGGSYHDYAHRTLRFFDGAPLMGPFGVVTHECCGLTADEGFQDYNGTHLLWDDEDGQVYWHEVGGPLVSVTASIAGQIPNVTDIYSQSLLRDGRILGRYVQQGNVYTAFAWSPDGTIELLPENGVNTINDLGWVLSGELYIDGQPIVIDDHLDASGNGWSDLSASRLNARGQVVARGRFNGGPLQFVLLTPLAFRWANAAGGNWDVGANWLPGQPPGERDTAEFDLAGAYTVSLTADTTNAVMQVSGTSAAEVANPRLQVRDFTYQAELIAVQPHGHLELDGASGAVRANNLHVAPGGKLSGNGRLRSATDLVPTAVTMDGEITLGPPGDPAPVRQRFLNTDGGPEPAEFFAHLAVRGSYTQGANATMNVVLTPEKAVNEGARAAAGLDAAPRSADLFVVGDAEFNAILDGRLRATTVPGYVPQHGDKFVIVDGDVLASNFADYEVPNAFNNLPLKPINTDSQLQLVTPQKIVLAWGHDLPVGLEGFPILGHRLNRIAPFDSEEAFTSANAAALAEYQNNLLAHVRSQFFHSFIEGIELVIGDPEPGAINVYFLEKFPEFGSLLGIAYTGIDRFNIDPDGEAAIIVNGFRNDDPNDFELDAETVTHEVGHLLGLRHVDPPGAEEVMDYDSADGDIEEFTDGVFHITEPPRAGGTVFPHTHNPNYYLKRYIDGYSHEELDAQGILPGTWDLPGAIGEGLNVNFSLRTGGEGDPSTTLYDVLVFASPSEDITDVLAEIDEITLEQLAVMKFGVNETEGIGLLAKSAAEGEYDIALAPGNPFESDALVLYPELGQVEGFLQMASALPAGFETLAEIMLSVSLVSDLLGDFNADGAVDAADYVVWRKNPAAFGSNGGYDTWRTNFGRTAASGATAGSPSSAVPEPTTVFLLLIAVLMTVKRRCVAG